MLLYVLVLDILALEIDLHVHYMIFCLQNSLRFNLRASIFQKFPGGMPPNPPSISMLHMLIVLHTVTHIITPIQKTTL